MNISPCMLVLGIPLAMLLGLLMYIEVRPLWRRLRNHLREQQASWAYPAVKWATVAAVLTIVIVTIPHIHFVPCHDATATAQENQNSSDSDDCGCP